MENEKMGFFKRIGIALAKPREYSRLAKDTSLNTILTFAIVTIVQVLVITGLITYLINFIANKADEYFSQLPNFSISSDGITSDMQDSVIIEDDINTQLFIFDTRKSLSDIKTEYSEKVLPVVDYILVGKDGIQVQNASVTEMFSFNNFGLGDNTIDKDQIIHYISSFLQKTFIIAFAITLFIFLFIGKLIGGIIFAGFGAIIANTQQKKLSFKELFNIGMYSGTLTALMFLLGGFLFVASTAWLFAQVVISGIYVYVAIKNYSVDNAKINVKIE